MKDDPNEICRYLITQHGSITAALAAAIESAAEAQAMEDLYALSIWRDVKRILREKITDQPDLAQKAD